VGYILSRELHDLVRRRRAEAKPEF
jgi:hypothetical protein